MLLQIFKKCNSNYRFMHFTINSKTYYNENDYFIHHAYCYYIKFVLLKKNDWFKIYEL